MIPTLKERFMKRSFSRKAERKPLRGRNKKKSFSAKDFFYDLI
jgi:hypothetical protein